MQDFSKDSNRQFTGKPADELLAFALGYFGETIALQTRFSREDQVLTDLIVQMIPETLIYVRDSGQLPEEITDMMHQTEAHFGIRIPLLSDQHIQTAGLEALITGERNSIPGNSAKEHFEWDETRNLVLIRPLLAWTDEMVDSYIRQEALPLPG